MTRYAKPPIDYSIDQCCIDPGTVSGEDTRDAIIARQRLEEIRTNPNLLISMDELEDALDDIMTRYAKPPIDYSIDQCCIDPGTPPLWTQPLNLVLIGSILGTGIAGFWIGICWRAAL